MKRLLTAATITAALMLPSVAMADLTPEEMAKSDQAYAVLKIVRNKAVPDVFDSPDRPYGLKAMSGGALGPEAMKRGPRRVPPGVRLIDALTLIPVLILER